MELKDFKFEIDKDGIATITWNCPDKQYNILSQEGFKELIHLVGELKNNKTIIGAIITSSKTSFCAGADINMISELLHDGDDVAEQMRLASLFSKTLRQLETCGKPVVCAMTGTTLGGGFELALACHYRISALNPLAKYGLPEVKIGILPGGGGTQRLPRLIGAKDALEMMLTGKVINDKTAAKMGIIHEIVAPNDLLKIAKQRLFERKVLQPAWDRKGFRIPGGAVYSKAGMMTFSPANALYRKSSYDNYPAGRNILKCVYEGLMVNIDTGLEIEARYFTNLLRSVEAKHMMRSIFTSMQALRKNIHKSDDHETTKFKKVGVVGAGLMGAGIAYVCALNAIDVVLIDQDEEAAQKGYQYSADILSKKVSKGRLSAQNKDRILNYISPSSDFADLADVDLVIEAVFEDVDVKNHVNVEIAKHVKEGVIIGSNTSTLPITELAKAAKHADQFAGIHFFSPVDKMMLVEVIKGDKTSQETVDRILDFVAQIRKTPIVVNDSRGFYTSRVVISYVTEAMYMLEEGIPPIMIEKAGKMAGMPVGALTLADEIGLDVAHKITLAHKKAVGKGYKAGPRDRLLKLMVDDNERLGKKNKKGLFDYGEGRKKTLWPGLLDYQETKIESDQVDMVELGKRFLTIQAVETARCYEENVLTDIREADVGGILGFGFAPFTGGPLSYIDMLGSKHFVKRLRRYAKKYGTRFKSTTGLNKMFKTDATYYD